jgi:succinyl-diaminopimelate desuccinylase
LFWLSGVCVKKKGGFGIFSSLHDRGRSFFGALGNGRFFCRSTVFIFQNIIAFSLSFCYNTFEYSYGFTVRREVNMYTELIEKIDREIEASERELVADIIRLVNIKSVEGEPKPGAPFGEGPRAVQDETVRMGEAIGLHAKDYGCGVVSLATEEKEPDLGIWLHADVVAADGTGWTFEPYNAVEYKGCVIGRGASDNKGQLTGIYHVFKIFKKLGIRLSYNAAMYVAANEETGMKDLIGREGDAEARGFLNVAKPPRMSLVPDGGFPVAYGGKGGCTFTLASDKALESCALTAKQGFAYATFARTDLPKELPDCKLTVKDGCTTV